MRKRLILAVAAGALLAAGPAQAHVTLQPREAPADSFARLNVRVPNERDRASTEKVRLQFPPGFLAISYEPSMGGRLTSRRASSTSRPSCSARGSPRRWTRSR